MTTINIKTLDGLLEIFGSYQSIVDALGYVPANADGVLTNEYFKDLDGDNFIISDKSGNIITKIDQNGLETTKVKATEFEGDLKGDVTGKVTGTLEGTVIGDVVGDVTGNVTGDLTGNVNADLVETETLITSTIQNTGENYIIADNSGNMILKVDSNGLETTKVKATEFEGDVTGNVTGKVTGTLEGTVIGDVVGNVTGDVTGDVTGNLTGNVNADLVEVETLITSTIQNTAENYIIADNSGNMILKVDSNGLETTKVKATEFEGDLKGDVTGNADTSTYSQSSGHSVSADKVLNKLTINAGTSTSTTSIEYDGSSEQVITITPSILGLTSAMLYIGTSTSIITDGGTQIPTINGSVVTPTAGNVIIYDNKEFIYNGSNWEILGDEINHKVLQTPVSSPTTSGTTKAFIDTIEQDANGNITVTKKTFDESTLNSDIITSGIINVTNTANINKVVTDNLEQSGDNFVFADSNGNIIAKIDSNGLKTTNIEATNNISTTDLTVTNTINGSISGNAESANKLNTDAGTNTKPVYFENGIPVQCDDTLDVNINWNNIINPPNETDTISGHTHSFTPNGSIESEFESTEHNHTFESTEHTHEITDIGHNHSINNIIDEVSLETNYNEGTRKLKINIAVSKININTDTKTTNININNANVEGDIGNTIVTGNVTSTFNGDTLETTENGEHNHEI